MWICATRMYDRTYSKPSAWELKHEYAVLISNSNRRMTAYIRVEQEQIKMINKQ